ncbi:hypothetical protein FRC11_004804, partial [Ceratobasidium sp. 423]
RYTQQARQSPVSLRFQGTSSSDLTDTVKRSVDVIEESHTATNNAGTGADDIETICRTQGIPEATIRDAMERSNRLAEQANRIAERSNRMIEQLKQFIEQPNKVAERFNELFERLNQHFEQSNKHCERSNYLTEELAKPVVKIGELLRNINKVLVKIQHAIIRNHKGNTIGALDCLVNEKGDTIVSDSAMAGDLHVEDISLPQFLRFYGIDDGLCGQECTSELNEGKEIWARVMLSSTYDPILIGKILECKD